MSTTLLSVGLLLAARLPLYCYVVYVGYRHRSSNTDIPFRLLYIMGLLGVAIAIFSVFTELRLLRDILGGAYAIILFIAAYNANKAIERERLWRS